MDVTGKSSRLYILSENRCSKLTICIQQMQGDDYIDGLVYQRSKLIGHSLEQNFINTDKINFLKMLKIKILDCQTVKLQTQ